MTIRNQARASLLARAFSYPYAAPSSPVVFRQGRLHGWQGMRVDIDGDGFAHIDGIGACLPLLAVGSNAAHSALRRKFGSSPVTLVQGPVNLPGYAKAHSAHIARYGALPATLVEAGNVLRSHLQFVPLKQLAALDASEAVGVNYERVRLSVDGLDAHWLPKGVSCKLTSVWTYRSLHGVAIREGAPLLLGHQRDALSHAAQRAGWRLDLEAFVVQLVRDQGFRLAVSAALKSPTEDR